jgi:N-acetylneuraminic acid mutarotase
MTGSMVERRFGAPVSPLPDGRVLVSGGFGRFSFPVFRPIESAEVYDPASGTWSATGSMAAPRASHTAKLLPGGKVLVAGGISGDYTRTVAVATAEVYDPALGTWSATGSMATSRVLHTLTLLPNGQVLVVGGRRDGTSPNSPTLATAELYDPASGTWSATGSMAAPRASHRAVLLPNGQVLVVDGLTTPEVYDPASGTWSATGSMTELSGNYYTLTLLPNGQVLVVDGLTTPQVYDAASGTWSATGSMTEPRGNSYTVTLLPNGQVLVAGGSAGSSMLATAEVYDPALRTWSATGSMSTPRAGHTATLLPDGKVLVAGGTPEATSEVYDPVTGDWGMVWSMSEPRFFHAAALLPDGKVVVFWGRPTYEISPLERVPRFVGTVEVYPP